MYGENWVILIRTKLQTKRFLLVCTLVNFGKSKLSCVKFAKHTQAPWDPVKRVFLILNIWWSEITRCHVFFFNANSFLLGVMETKNVRMAEMSTSAMFHSKYSCGFFPLDLAS